jgi:predicted helicase
VRPFLYKPFDHRFIYYNTTALGRARHSTMRHMMKPNLALVATRQVTRLPFCHAFVSRWPIEEKTGSHDRTTQLLPLYVYPQARQLELNRPGGQNDCPECALSSSFIAKLHEMLGGAVDGARRGHAPDLLKPENVFHYVYSILNSPSYREQFGPELMQDFARIPLTGNVELFRSLSSLGGELVALHLMESPELDTFIVTYTGPNNPKVGSVGWSEDTVWLDGAATKKGKPPRPGTIGFRGVPEAVWTFHIGGYQVCEKWLKDRKGRTLSKDDIAHYQKIVVAIAETIRLMKEIDEVIDAHGGWPAAFSTGKGVKEVDGQ